MSNINTSSNQQTNNNPPTNAASVSRCTRCGARNHLESECRTKICDTCHSFGHLAETCRKDIRNVKCYGCQATGHKIQDCPQEKKQREYIPRTQGKSDGTYSRGNNNYQERPKYCGFCRIENSHTMRECAELKKHHCELCNEKGHFQRYCNSPYIRRS